jgi:Fic family protein
MQPFVPQALPPVQLRLEPLIPRIGRATWALAHYAGVLHGVPNPDVMLAPLTTQEAVLSSRMEGTQATLGDVLKFEAGEPPLEKAREADIHEILNYRKALRAAEAELPKRPFSLNMLRGLHAILLSDVRGQDKTPGRFRTIQNWIGADGCLIDRAAFVPPMPEQVPSHMERWNEYYHADQPDPLVQLAVVHAQFEIIHPFADGNGRLGRILIPIFLFEKELLHRPMFYLSIWLEQRREEYVARLRAIGREPDAWNAWTDFFLRGIAEQAAANADTARAIMALYEELKSQVLDLTHSQFAVPLLDQLFEKPFFQSRHLKFGKRPPTKPAVANLLRMLREAKILSVVREGAGRRGTVYALRDLINMCEGKQVIR